MSDKSRNIIINRIKNTAREEPENSSPGFHFLKTYQQPLLKTFEEKLKAVQGIYMYSNNKTEFQNHFKQLVQTKRYNDIFCIEPQIQKMLPVSLNQQLTPTTQVAVTGCEQLVAQTGSAILSTTQTFSRRSFAYPPVHIIVAFKNQLVSHLEDGLTRTVEKYKKILPSQITTITGPSRTADIEKTLVLGTHGPKELIIFYIDDNLE